MSRDYTFAFGANPSTNTGLAPTFIFFVNASGQTIAPPSISELLTGSGLYKASYNATQMISFVLDGATTALATSDRYISGVMDPADKFAGTLTAMGTTLAGMGATLAGVGSTVSAINTNVVNQGSTLVAYGGTLAAIGTNVTNTGATLVACGGTLSSIATQTAGLGLSMTAQGATLVAMGDTLTTMSALMGSTQASFGSTASDPTTLFGFMRRLQELGEGSQVYTKASGLFALYSRGSGTSTLLRTFTVTDTAAQTTRE